LSERKAAKGSSLTEIFLDGSRRKIDGLEKGIAFYGKGDQDLVPFENLIPAANACAGESVHGFVWASRVLERGLDA
jgi:hypothetical protein